MSERYDLFGGEVALWIEQEVVHFRAVGPHGDPIELTAEMCRELARSLQDLTMKIDE